MGEFFGGLFGGLGSLVSGFMNSSAISSANQANIAQAQYQETGAYLPALVKNAQAAGLNPLAVLPGGGGSANIQPNMAVGDAVGNFGQNIARALSVNSQQDEKLNHLKEQLIQSQIRAADASTARSTVESARMLDPPGHPPSLPREKRSTLAWPLSIPDDLVTHIKAEQGIDLNSINRALQSTPLHGIFTRYPDPLSQQYP